MSTAITGKVIPEKITIQGVNIAKAAIDTTDEYLSKPELMHDAGIAFETETGFDHEQKRCRIRLRVDMQAINEKKENLGLKGFYDIIYFFHIENLDELSSNEKEELVVSGALISTLLGIAYSTTRGIILERTAGTFFNGLLLPVVDPKYLMNPHPNADKETT